MKNIFIRAAVVFSITACLFSQTAAAVNGVSQKTRKGETPVLLKVKNDPAISIRIVFHSGVQNDPEGKEGLAYLTARMISEGATKSNSYEKILEKLFPLAAYYNVSASMEQTVFSGKVHRDNLEEYYKLFIDAILNPAFAETDFQRIKDETLSYLTTTLKYSSDEELGKALLYNYIFEDTHYGHIAPGTISSIKSITLDDIKNFYRKNYTRSNYLLGIGGGFPDGLAKRLTDDLNKLSDAEAVIPAKPAYKEIKGLNVMMADKQANATAISIGFPINLQRGSKDWYALAIANSWMGEHRNSSSHLYQVIREKRGLNYGDYSYIENFPNGGQRQMPPVNVARRQQIFEIWIRPVPNETAHFSLRAALRELKKLTDNGMTPEDFKLTQGFLYKYVLHYAPDTDTRLGYALDDRFYGIKGSHLENFRKIVKELTVEDVNRAIKKYLQYDNLKVAIVTSDAEALKNKIVANTPSPITYATPKSEEILAEDKDISSFPLDIKPGNVHIVKVEDLFIK